MIYLLDGDTVISGLRGQPPIIERLRAARGDGGDIALSAITLLQLRHRITKGPRRFEERAELRRFLAEGIGVLAFDADDAAMAGELQFAIEAARTPIGAYDLLIAAQALRRGATLITAADSDLARIPGLLAQDWRL